MLTSTITLPNRAVLILSFSSFARPMCKRPISMVAQGRMHRHKTTKTYHAGCVRLQSPKPDQADNEEVDAGGPAAALIAGMDDQALRLRVLGPSQAMSNNANFSGGQSSAHPCFTVYETLLPTYFTGHDPRPPIIGRSDTVFFHSLVPEENIEMRVAHYAYAHTTPSNICLSCVP